MKHLIPEFEQLRARYPRGFDSSLVLPCLRRIQEDRGYVADSDIDELAAYLGVPRIQIEEVLVVLHAVPARADRPLPHPGVPQRLVLDARRRARCSTTCRAGSASSPARPRADGRFTLSTRRVPGLVRHRAGGDGQRRVPREHDAGDASTR